MLDVSNTQFVEISQDPRNIPGMKLEVSTRQIWMYL